MTPPDPTPDPQDPRRAPQFALAVGMAIAAIATPAAGLLASQWAAMAWVESASPLEDEIRQTLSAHKHLATLDVFAPSPRTRDVGVILNRHLEMDRGRALAESPMWWTRIADSEDHIREDWLDRPGALRDESGGPRYDDSVLEMALAYDHWDIASSGAFRDPLDAPDDLGPAGQMPNLTGLQHLAKARLSRGLFEEDILPALQEVRHIARMLVNSEGAVSFAIGLSLLQSERDAMEHAVADGILAPDAWSPVAAADINLSRTELFRGARLLLLPDQPAAENLFKQPVVAGRCAMLETASLAFIYTQDSMGTHRAPLEADFISTRRRYEALWAASGCTLEPTARHLRPDDGPDAEAKRSMHLPYLRSIKTAAVFHQAMFYPVS